MKMKYVKPLLIIIVLMIFSNVSPIRHILRIDLDENRLRYTNIDGTFTFEERSKGHYDIEVMELAYASFKKNHPNQKDNKVYRLFWKNPFAFWRWYDYFQEDKRYDLPYLSPCKAPEPKKRRKALLRA